MPAPRPRRGSRPPRLSERRHLAALDRLRPRGPLLQPHRRDGPHLSANAADRGGKTQFQPVYVADVAQAVIAGLDGRARPGVTYELGGPRAYSFRELLDLVADCTEHRRPFFPIPFWLAKVQGAIMQLCRTRR